MGEWHNNGLEFMTFTDRDDHSFQYYVKASKALRKSKWTNFINSVGGHSLAIFRANKYKNPIDELRGTPREHEKSNTFTVDKNPPVSPQNSERSLGRKKQKKCAVSDVFKKNIEDFMAQPGLLWHVASKTFGADLDAEECKLCVETVCIIDLLKRASRRRFEIGGFPHRSKVDAGTARGAAGGRFPPEQVHLEYRM